MGNFAPALAKKGKKKTCFRGKQRKKRLAVEALQPREPRVSKRKIRKLFLLYMGNYFFALSI
jgi:hypothetical protein